MNKGHGSLTFFSCRYDLSCILQKLESPIIYSLCFHADLIFFTKSLVHLQKNLCRAQHPSHYIQLDLMKRVQSTK
jgi:hypothetical protein